MCFLAKKMICSFYKYKFESTDPDKGLEKNDKFFNRKEDKKEGRKKGRREKREEEKKGGRRGRKKKGKKERRQKRNVNVFLG